MQNEKPAPTPEALPLHKAAPLGPEKLLNPAAASKDIEFKADLPTLILLAAGKGTRFGQEPKCAQPVGGIPLARHSIEAFRKFSPSPVVCVVGYRHQQVAEALGAENIYVRSDNPAGGTAYALYEAFSVPGIEASDPLIIVSMGDRIVTGSIFRRLYETHLSGSHEADLTFLTAIYEPPRNLGKGRIIRDSNRRVLGIVEQKDIDAIPDLKLRESLDALTEGNCPLYAIRARALRRLLESLTNNNAQRQYYLTDIIEVIRHQGGEIRTITTAAGERDYDLLCSDVTRPADLELLEATFRASKEKSAPESASVGHAAAAISAQRPIGQVASISNQLQELVAAADQLGFKKDLPVAIGISGGRLRIAFMHPDMGRFFGPAWQMPIGASDATGREQIVVLMQTSEDRRLHLAPTNPEFQEKICSLPADIDCMYPGADVANWYSYEGFGTHMAERLLLSLGYFTDQEIQARKERGDPLPPASLWVSTSMRRPFSLVGNAIASMRTVRSGTLGAKVQAVLGRDSFTGLKIVTSGNIPRGGFSSSSALTVATKNAINALYDLEIPADFLVHLSCQAEYGTGVRAGSLDQATEQKGQPGKGTLISSNPRDNYRILGTYALPADRFRVFFPYSVERDRAAWRWSAGVYSAEPMPGKQTTGEMRKMTGKAAELAAILIGLPIEEDFFPRLQTDLLATGRIGIENRSWICDVLRKLPLLVSQQTLREKIEAKRSWYVGQLAKSEDVDENEAAKRAETTLNSLFAGWRDPRLRRTLSNGEVVEETGVPLRAIVAYLFAEVAKNFYLIHHPEEWIECVTRSQRGDRCFEIDMGRMPSPVEMQSELNWEKGLSGPELLGKWLERCGARPFDYNRGLEDAALDPNQPPEIHHIEGTNFFRGLALLDLVEAMLKRAFGSTAVALRVNAAGQGDFFQVHVDLRQLRSEQVKDFLRRVFYRRFGLNPEPEFVEPRPGGGALGVRLDRFDELEGLSRALASGTNHK